MSYQPPGSQQGPLVENTQVAMITYVLFVAGCIVPVLPIIALIMAYVNRDTAPAWLATHYTWIIRTFWIGLAYLLLFMILVLVGIGILLLLILPLWILVRLIRGLMLLNNRQPVPDPRSWLF